jgi:predicted HicB family RNase H-like nuclease
MMQYKGYTGQVTDPNARHRIMHGRVVGIRDVVTFEGTTQNELVQAFRDSVDDYLDFCEERGKMPQKPATGV